MTEPSSTANNQSVDTGILGEDLVARWLEGQGWQILARRWRCRWGELDLVAMENVSPMLAFVEVKTRRGRSWDGGGLLSITESKQEKLCLAAEMFLSDRSKTDKNWADYSCRFDVALVNYRALSQNMANNRVRPLIVEWGRPVAVESYEFVLQEYIESAFSSY
jgi:putative endonuclease